jgi:hypothetical protein
MNHSPKQDREKEELRSALQLMVDMFGPRDGGLVFSTRYALEKARSALEVSSTGGAENGGVAIDLAFDSLQQIRKTYFDSFGPLDANITANDIDWEICELIKSAAKNAGDALLLSKCISASNTAEPGQFLISESVLDVDRVVVLAEKSEFEYPDSGRKDFDRLGFARAIEAEVVAQHQERCRAILSGAVATDNEDEEDEPPSANFCPNCAERNPSLHWAEGKIYCASCDPEGVEEVDVPSANSTGCIKCPRDPKKKCNYCGYLNLTASATRKEGDDEK